VNVGASGSVILEACSVPGTTQEFEHPVWGEAMLVIEDRKKPTSPDSFIITIFCQCSVGDLAAEPRSLLDDETKESYTPGQLGLQMNSEDEAMWTNETIGRCVTRLGVQHILDQLLMIERKYASQNKSTGFPNAILEVIGLLRKEEVTDIDDRLSKLPVY